MQKEVTPVVSNKAEHRRTMLMQLVKRKREKVGDVLLN